jgi:hypothetical protein
MCVCLCFCLCTRLCVVLSFKTLQKHAKFHNRNTHYGSTHRLSTHYGNNNCVLPGDWDATMRLIEEIGLSPTARGAQGSALEAASRAGHAAMVNYLLYVAAMRAPLGPHGNLLFSSGSYAQLQAAGVREGRAQEVYTLRALEMVRSHTLYTERSVFGVCLCVNACVKIHECGYMNGWRKHM